MFWTNRQDLWNQWISAHTKIDRRVNPSKKMNSTGKKNGKRRQENLKKISICCSLKKKHNTWDFSFFCNTFISSFHDFCTTLQLKCNSPLFWKNAFNLYKLFLKKQVIRISVSKHFYWTYLLISFKNPLILITNKDRISPYNVNTISSRKVIRIKEMSMRVILVDPIPNTLS